MKATQRTCQLCLVLLIYCCLAEAMDLDEFTRKFPPLMGPKYCYRNGQLHHISCLDNMKYGSCTQCQWRTCDDPDKCVECSEPITCVCPNGFMMDGYDCIQQEKCGCYISDAEGGKGMVLREGGVYTYPNCTGRRSCTNGELSFDVYKCSPNAVCKKMNNSRQCYCNTNYTGDGVQCMMPSDCQDIYTNGQVESGVYTIKPANWTGEPFNVSCNMENGGGWTVFQRRHDQSVSFYRDWNEYKEGFGNPSGDHWLGNDKLHILTNQRNYQLLVNLTKSGGTPYYALYNTFSVGDEESKYQLTRKCTCSGDAGSLGNKFINGALFSTYDRDNDLSSSYNCAMGHRSGWWYYYSSYRGSAYCYRWHSGGYYMYCTLSNLNGDYNGAIGQKLFWYKNAKDNDCTVQTTELKIRHYN